MSAAEEEVEGDGAEMQTAEEREMRVEERETWLDRVLRGN